MTAVDKLRKDDKTDCKKMTVQYIDLDTHKNKLLYFC